MNARYVVARTATKNPMINGCTLYLCSIGFWTLDITQARKFETRADAVEAAGTRGDARIEKVEQ